MPFTHRKLRVFLCHTAHDKPLVRDVYIRLESEGWIDPWLDEEKLLAGLEWGIQIEKAVESTDAVIVFLSAQALTKEGYVQKELRLALDLALYKPENSIFIIPLRLDNSGVPYSLKSYQYIDYFPSDKTEISYKKLLSSLDVRARRLGIDIERVKENHQREIEELKKREITEKIYRETREKVWREEEKKIRKEAEERARKEISEEINSLIKEGRQREAQEKAKREKEQINKKAQELYQKELELLRRRQANDDANKESDFANEFPVTPYPEKETNSGLITVVVVILLCFCCAVIAGGWFFGDSIIQSMGL